MSRVTSTKTRDGNYRVKFPGLVRKMRARRIKWPFIGEVATEQGVTRQHLYQVLEGNRTSPRLKAAYELKRQQKEKGTP